MDEQLSDVRWDAETRMFLIIKALAVMVSGSRYDIISITLTSQLKEITAFALSFSL